MKCFWYKYILSGKKEVLQILDGKVEDYDTISLNIQDIKLQPVAAYFYKQNIDIKQLSDVLNHLSEILYRNPIEIQYTKNGIKFGNEIFNNWLRFSEKVHSIYSLIKINNNKIDVEQNDIENGKIMVFKAHNANDCIKYGHGTNWCISQPYNTLYQSYRDRQGSTFYFIFDGFQPEKSPLRKVVVDINKNGIDLTDLDNTTGTIYRYNTPNLYFEYLKNHGVNIDVFKNDPLSESEKKESQVLGKRNTDIQWFMSIPYDYKSKYIGRGHELSNDQFKYLLHHKAWDLLKQYVSTGIELNGFQSSELKTNNPQIFKTYNVARDRYIDSLIKNKTEQEVREIFENTQSQDVYSRLMQKGFRSKDPGSAYHDAYFIGADTYTRELASEIPQYALLYAKNVDKNCNIITYNGVKQDLSCLKQYIEYFGKDKINQMLRERINV